MKTFRFALSAAVLAASISFAQTKQGDVVADVPFAFVVAGRTLPAGHYIVSRLADNVSIHDLQNHGTFVAAHSVERPEHENSSKLVFHRYGDVYFLSEVWVTGNSIGRALLPSQAERRLGERGNEREIAVVRDER
jgi:hypothetical protein